MWKLVVLTFVLNMIKMSWAECKGDANATIGCDTNCSRRCPSAYLMPTQCSCPENSCSCNEGYYFDQINNYCVLLGDCALTEIENSKTTFGKADDATGCSSYPNAELGCDSKCERLCPNPRSYTLEKCECPVDSCRCKKGFYFDTYKFMCVSLSKCTTPKSNDDNDNGQWEKDCAECCSCEDGSPETCTTQSTALDCDDGGDKVMSYNYFGCEYDDEISCDYQVKSNYSTEDCEDTMTTNCGCEGMTSTTEQMSTTTEGPECPAAVSKIKKTLSQIAPKVLYALVQSNPLKTVVISILSLSNLLGLYKPFTYGKTMAELWKVLPLDNEELRCALITLNNIGKYLPPGSYETGKVVAADIQYTFNKKFINVVEDILQGKVFNINLQYPKQSSKKINKSLASQTHGTVTNVSSPDRIPNALERLASVCASFSQLELQIPSGRKVMKDFFVEAFNVIVRSYICQTITLNYFESKALKSKIVEIQLSIGILVIVLPDSRLGAEDVMKIMLKNPCLLDEERKKLKPEMVNMCLPLFNANTFINVTDIVIKTKLATRLFTPEAELRGIVSHNKPVAAGGAQQCVTEMTISEKHPKIIMSSKPSQKEYKFDCSHPFIFLTIVNGFMDKIGLVAN